MSAYYRKAEECHPEAYEILTELRRRYRTDLDQCEATITVLFAYSLKEGKPALKHHGQAVAGMAEISSLKDRVQGKADAVITLDGDGWKLRKPIRQTALLDHELSHIGVDRDADGMIKRDDINRPALKLVFGDWENDGFYAVARRYGEDAPEVAYLRRVQRTIAEQAELPLGDPLDAEEPADDRPRIEMAGSDGVYHDVTDAFARLVPAHVPEDTDSAGYDQDSGPWDEGGQDEA